MACPSDDQVDQGLDKGSGLGRLGRQLTQWCHPDASQAPYGHVPWGQNPALGHGQQEHSLGLIIWFPCPERLLGSGLCAPPRALCGRCLVTLGVEGAGASAQRQFTISVTSQGLCLLAQQLRHLR